MSFTSTVKNEVSKINTNDSEKLTLLSAIVHDNYNGNIKIINSLSVSSFTSNPQLVCNNISVCYNSNSSNGNIIIAKASSESTKSIDELIANDENNTLTIKFAMNEFIDW